MNPDAQETCNAIDDDCDGLTDDDDPPVTGRTVFYVDDNGDGVGGGDHFPYCVRPAGYVDTSGDCDNSDPAVYPGATELCGTAADDNCNRMISDCRMTVDESDLVLLAPVGAAAFVPWRVGVGDLNADGVPDLVASAFGDDDSVSVVFGPKSGEHSVDEADLCFSGSSLSLDLELAVGDADGDGEDDLLLGADSEDVAYLFLGPTTSGADVTAPDATLSERSAIPRRPSR